MLADMTFIIDRGSRLITVDVMAYYGESLQRMIPLFPQLAPQLASPDRYTVIMRAYKIHIPGTCFQNDLLK